MNHLAVLAIALFLPPLPAGDIVIDEINFDPPVNTTHQEFVELHDAGDSAVDLSGWFLAGGIRYVFPDGTLIQPGGYLVVAADPSAVVALGCDSALGPFDGILSNEGDRIVLRNAEGGLEDEVSYGIGFPWPTACAGEGSSLELIHPALDRAAGSSWRASGAIVGTPPARSFFVDASAADWHWRPGTSEASTPASAWREKGFVEDASWQVGQTAIGYGDASDKTVIADMQGRYTSVYLRRTFAAAGPFPAFVKISLYADDGAVVWINGTEVARLRVKAGAAPAFNGKASQASPTPTAWTDIVIPNPGRFLVEGENVIAIHALVTGTTAKAFAIDARLFALGTEDYTAALLPPTPGWRNSVWSEAAPPEVREVRPATAQPRSGQDVRILATVTAADGIDSVVLQYQVVKAGAYIPAFLPVPLATLVANANAPRPPNPAFEAAASWTAVPMKDDATGGDAVAGDSIYTAVIPAQTNRTLVRYRVVATGSNGLSVRVPYADDPALNFACFVHDGVPDYAATTSITGKATVYPAANLTSLPVYFLITRKADLAQCIAANAGDQIQQGLLARFAENWEGTWVYDGVVYDHIDYRLRGANGRYQIPPTNPSNIAGKRHWHFKFNKGHSLQTRDRFGNPYPTKWKALLVCRMFGNRLDGNWGLSEQVNDILWDAYGVAAPRDHYFHWRVITGTDEAPAGAGGQYLGDFWGLAWAQENYDKAFLDAHDLPPANLYKLVNQTDDAIQQEHYQAPDAVTGGKDEYNIQNTLGPGLADSWLDAYVDFPEWYRYHSICQAIRNYDYWPKANKNAAWYFYPDYTAANSYYGRLQIFPFDTDATWGPTWNDGHDDPYSAIFDGSGKPEFQKAYRNQIREVRDLLWQRDQLEPVIRQTAAFAALLEKPDIDRWRNAPAEANRQYFPNGPEATLEGKIADMLKFAFTGGAWPGDSGAIAARSSFLDGLADGVERATIPKKPVVTYTGPAGFPIDGLRFSSSAFSDPKAGDVFGGMKWRIAEVTKIANPASIPLTDPSWKIEPVRLEIHAGWESEEIAPFDAEITIPVGPARPGRTYRVRVRMRDGGNVWSHWSDPVEFVAGPPAGAIPQLEWLRVTEIMYAPVEGQDLEFVEIQNRGPVPVELDGVRLGGAIRFSFADGAVGGLPPGRCAVVVSDLEAFARFYDAGGMLVAGQFAGRLGNKGERIILALGDGLVVQDFTYGGGWYREADGRGRSLTIRDVNGPAGAWDDPDAWFPSSVEGGTPGWPDPAQSGAGLVRPGDANLDGRLDIIDPLDLLFRIFADSGRPPPCGAAALGSGGSLRLLDANGDGTVDLADAIHVLGYLFLEGPPPVLGEACLPIDGCPSACR